MKQNCIIIGAGTYGQVYAEYLKDSYNVIAFYDDDVRLHNSKVNSIEVVGKVSDALSLPKSTAIFVPIGNNPIRVELLKKFEENGFDIASYIHPQTIIHPSVKIGKAVYILPGTNIMPLSVIGDYSMISMGVNIAHHTIIEEACFFSQGSNIGASILLKTLAYVGISATLMTGLKTIGRNSLIGAGAVVIKDVPENAVMAGVPAKIIKYH
ncbi:MAG TPA: acetyltransferase [Epulopiscium sp.]|nr:acetyltransferase [Candidatus Epulonipiscium sp.]